jgi:uncharacterized membrane protein YhhN
MSTPSTLVNRLGVLLAAGTALVFLITLGCRPYQFAYLIKSLPVFILAILIYLNLNNTNGRLLGLGLFFSGIGDVVLEFDSGALFVYGILAFAIAHLFYISVFLQQVKLTALRVVAVLILLSYSLVLAYILYPITGKMFIPLVIYLGIILIMATSATLGAKNGILIALGAWLFVISDSLIAINRYILPIRYSSFWIMISYYAAQGLITYGSFNTFRNSDRPSL